MHITMAILGNMDANNLQFSAATNSGDKSPRWVVLVLINHWYGSYLQPAGLLLTLHTRNVEHG